ncbi:MAG: type I glutamate--ammonia ligase [Thermoplasmata archaeon]
MKEYNPNTPDAVQKAVQLLKESDAKWVYCHMTDIMGHLHSITLPAKSFTHGNIWETGIGVDGSSLMGTIGVEKSDIIAMPDATTLKILPAVDDGQRYGRVMMSLMDRSGGYFEGDPRHIARRMEAEMREAGFSDIYFSPELEFYVIPKQEAEKPCLGTGRYSLKHHYLMDPAYDITDKYRNEFSELLESFGYPVKYHHHECGRNQVEIEVKLMKSPVLTGDFIQFYKFLAKIIAKKYNFHATFMPKPFEDDAGSGMHVHVMLMKDNENAFYDPKDPLQLSKVARSFIAGIFRHIKALTAVCNPSVNSYRRLVTGMEAPVYISWSAMNRSALVRVPLYKSTPTESKFELRSPDPTANPYLCLAGIIACGLDGIRNNLVPPESVDQNIYQMSDNERKQLGIERLPRNLEEALDAFEKDDVLRKAFGEHIFKNFLAIKRKAYAEFSCHVTDWEYDRYFNY